MLELMTCKSAVEADHAFGSACVVLKFEFPALGNGGGGFEKSTVATPGCVANPWNGCEDVSRLGDCSDSFVIVFVSEVFLGGRPRFGREASTVSSLT